jgi:hypothetical protein
MLAPTLPAVRTGTPLRLCICGGPKTGKSSLGVALGNRLGLRVRHSDSVMGLGWSEASAEVASWFDEPGDVVIEGVAVVRAIRKWLAAHPTGRPCDELVVLDHAWAELTRNSEWMD